jgi:peptide/nickel transport system permease protein
VSRPVDPDEVVEPLLEGYADATTTDHHVNPDAMLEAEEAASLSPTPRRRRRRGVLFWAALAWIVVIILAAVFAGLLPLPGYGKPVGPPRMAPFQQWGNGLALGTDTFGRSNLSRIVYGARNSLLIAVFAALIGVSIGGFVGLVSGYLRGWTDRLSSFAVDTLLAFPPLVLLLTFTAVLQPKASTELIALSVLVIPTFVRLERAAAMSWSQRPFVLAARSYGTKELRIAVRHVLPNSALTLVTFIPTVIGALIIAEGSLSFLGLGIPSPAPSWGGMIADGKAALRTAPSVVFVPAVVVFLTVLSFNIIGETVRARLDTRARS